MKKYWIGTVDEYAEIVDAIEADKTIHRHAPIYNADETMVLVAGYGELTLAEVKDYQFNNCWTK